MSRNSRMNGGHWRVGCPPGVGDLYWVLTKLKALRAARSMSRVTLCIKKSNHDRALALASMVDFVDDACFVPFEPGPAETSGYLEGCGELDCVLWPGAVLDHGGYLDEWLPELATDLDFEIKAPDMGARRVVVYPSSVNINDRWVRRPAQFWHEIVAALTARYGRVTLVGAEWDKSFRAQLGALDVEDLIGETTLPELAGILRDARLVVGVICGVSILSNHFRTPCVALYPDHRFPPAFPHAWVASDAPYRALAMSRVRGAIDVDRAAVEVLGSAP